MQNFCLPKIAQKQGEKGWEKDLKFPQQNNYGQQKQRPLIFPSPYNFPFMAINTKISFFYSKQLVFYLHYRTMQ